MKVTSVQVDTWGFEKGRHEGAQITAARLLLRRFNTLYLHPIENKVVAKF